MDDRLDLFQQSFVALVLAVLIVWLAHFVLGWVLWGTENVGWERGGAAVCFILVILKQLHEMSVFRRRFGEHEVIAKRLDKLQDWLQDRLQAPVENDGEEDPGTGHGEDHTHEANNTKQRKARWYGQPWSTLLSLCLMPVCLGIAIALVCSTSNGGGPILLTPTRTAYATGETRASAERAEQASQPPGTPSEIGAQRRTEPSAAGAARLFTLGCSHGRLEPEQPLQLVLDHRKGSMAYEMTGAEFVYKQPPYWHMILFGLSVIVYFGMIYLRDGYANNLLAARYSRRTDEPLSTGQAVDTWLRMDQIVMVGFVLLSAVFLLGATYDGGDWQGDWQEAYSVIKFGFPVFLVVQGLTESWLNRHYYFGK